AMLTVACVLLVGGIWGGLPSWTGALLAVPILFVAGLGFASQGLLCTAWATGFESFSYFFTFWVTPMFVFSGVFFDLGRFPVAIRLLVWLLPMPHLLALVRPLTTGNGPAFWPGIGHLACLLLFLALPFALARRRIAERMFD